MTAYLSAEQVKDLHRSQLARYGGLGGLRDSGALEAAVARPQMTFGGEDLYQDVAAKAAALLHWVVLNHPFIDGNKRTAFVAVELFLALNGLELQASDEDCVMTMLALAAGELTEERFADWIRSHVVSA